jgi:hypothetical protein
MVTPFLKQKQMKSGKKQEKMENQRGVITTTTPTMEIVMASYPICML